MDPGRRRRRFYLITAIVFAAILVGAAAIVLYIDYSYVSVKINGSPQVSFLLAYDSTNVTLSASENATIAVLPHANVTIVATVSPNYTISSWLVSGVVFRERSGIVNFITGSGGSTITVSVQLKQN